MYAMAVGPFLAAEIDGLSTAASKAGLELVAAQSASEAKRHLKQSPDLPKGVFVSRHAELDALVSWMRDESALFCVPIIALVAHPSDHEFKRAFGCGADDALVEGDLRALERRLRSLTEVDPAKRPAAENGLALVAAQDLATRRQIGRTLRQAGFEVAFAAEARELVALSRTSDPALIVATPSFPPLGGEAAVRSVRTATCKPDLPALVMEGGARTSDPDHRKGDARGQILFVADELISRRSAAEQRRTKRLLYSTICAFRASGSMEPSYGLSYNFSREGLYIQTLDAPTPGSAIWIELRTPDGAPVHLRGTAMWRREASRLGGAPPPGFGLKLEPSHCPPLDLASYVLGYDRLLDERDAIN